MTLPRNGRVALLLLALVGLPCEGRAQVGAAPAAYRAVRALPALSDSAWAALVLSLSETGGFFDTDNLISNERTYLHVIGPLRRLEGGAYLGVGPDQNFSYIAAAQPAIAFLIDIRRDNFLHHLLLRSLFALSSNRAEYLARLHGRALPEDARSWDARPLEEILDRIDSLPVDPQAVRATRQAVDSLVGALPLPVRETDLATIRRFHSEFIEQGTALRFRSFGRAPRPFYPTYRELLLGRDREGQLGSYLVREEDFRRVKALQASNLIVPVVGDLAGPHAIQAIARWLEERGVGVSAYYTSNVEDYLWRDGSYGTFAENVRALPWTRNGVIIRSYFGQGMGGPLPGMSASPGSYSTQLLQPAVALLDALEALADGAGMSYVQVITAGMVELR